MSAVFSYLGLTASDWRGTAVTCTFTLVDNAGNPIPHGADPTTFSIPSSATSVVATATPIAAAAAPQNPVLYWDQTITFLIDPNTGILTPDASSAKFVTLLPPLANPLAIATVATIIVSRFKDVTDKILAAIPQPSMTLPDMPDARFLKVPPSGTKVEFAKDASVHVKADNVVLQLAGEEPALWGVSWHTDVPRTDGAASAPMLLYIRQGNAQYPGMFGDNYPINQAYATEGLWGNFAYFDDPVTSYIASKGVPYQVAKSGAKVVTVFPVNKEWVKGGKEYGSMTSTQWTGDVLVELQAYMFLANGAKKAPTSLGKVALASFSSSCDILAGWIGDETNQKSAFLTDKVTAVYYLDPSSDSMSHCLTAALAWAKAPRTDKCIRMYTRTLTLVGSDLYDFGPTRTGGPNKQPTERLLGPTVAVPAEPFVKNVGTTRTLSVISRETWINFFVHFSGKPFVYPYTPPHQDPKRFDWNYPHHAIAATMLSHALAQGDLGAVAAPTPAPPSP